MQPPHDAKRREAERGKSVNISSTGPLDNNWNCLAARMHNRWSKESIVPVNGQQTPGLFILIWRKRHVGTALSEVDMHVITQTRELYARTLGDVIPQIPSISCTARDIPQLARHSGRSRCSAPPRGRPLPARVAPLHPEAGPSQPLTISY